MTMKKVYKKPSVYMESFEMNTAICSCGPGANSGFWGTTPNHGDPNTCEYRDSSPNGGLVVMFTESNEDCVNAGAVIPSDGDGSIYCYQALSDNITVFAS